MLYCHKLFILSNFEQALFIKLERMRSAEMLLFVVWPTLRYILSQIRDYVLPTKADGAYEKLLITEDLPSLAWFWEIALKFVYIDAAVLHANLDSNERQVLQNRFNDPKDSLRVKIIMYSVSAQSMNLDKACSRVLVATPAVNAPLELQAVHRVIRVSILFTFSHA